MTREQPVTAQLGNFMWLFALAWAGGAVAYVPFITVLLPLRVASLSGARRVEILGVIILCGAVAASVGNIVFGWLSDRTRNRRPWVAFGMLLSIFFLLCFPFARNPTTLVGLVICWQLALNMMLGPLSAWAADRIPARRTGYFGGLVALSPAFGALSGIVVTLPGLASPDQRLWLVGGMVCACVLPALLLVRPTSPLNEEPNVLAGANQQRFPLFMWLARFLVQIAEAALFVYILIYFRSLDARMADREIARLFGGAVVTAVPLAILLGRWADKIKRPILVLAGCAFCSAVGLLVMSAATNVKQASVAYVGFGLATTTFLSLHSGQTLRMLPNPELRGRDLGLFNLTNTLPSIIMPVLAIAIVPTAGFPLFLKVLSLLALAASTILFSVGSLGATKRIGRRA